MGLAADAAAADVPLEFDDDELLLVEFDEHATLSLRRLDGTHHRLYHRPQRRFASSGGFARCTGEERSRADFHWRISRDYPQRE